MPVACIGLSHHTAPVAVRERLAFGREEVTRLLTTLDRERAWSAGIGEVALLSTCNRTELYLASRNPAEHFPRVPAFALEFLLGAHDFPREEVEPHLYELAGIDAVRHLCRVASGIDSMVVGESEVLGQVVTAHGIAADAGTTGLMLDAAFRVAIRAGRRARVETAIGRAATSVASEAICLVERLVEVSSNPSVVIVGAGQMAALLAQILTSRGFTSPIIVGRTAAKSVALARTYGGSALPWHELPAALRQASVVLSSTSAPHPVITAELVAESAGDRTPDRPLHFIDLAMPRDVDPAVRALPNATLHDLDDLQARVAENRQAREKERPRVEEVVQQEVAQFLAWLHGAELRPVLAAMHARGEEIRRRELDRILRRHPDADAALREEMERLSRSIVAKLLHGPSARLRTETDPDKTRHYVSALQQLFGLADGSDHRYAALP